MKNSKLLPKLITKKTILIILLCSIMIFGVTSCDDYKEKNSIGNKSDIKISKTNDVGMSIKDGTLTNTGATLILSNNRVMEILMK